jgi:hypothetical protein
MRKDLIICDLCGIEIGERKDLGLFTGTQYVVFMVIDKKIRDKEVHACPKCFDKMWDYAKDLLEVEEKPPNPFSALR